MSSTSSLPTPPHLIKPIPIKPDHSHPHPHQQKLQPPPPPPPSQQPNPSFDHSHLPPLLINHHQTPLHRLSSPSVPVDLSSTPSASQPPPPHHRQQQQQQQRPSSVRPSSAADHRHPPKLSQSDRPSSIKPRILLSSSESSLSSSSSSSSRSSSSHSNRHRSQQPTQSRDRIRTDSFFGIDKLDQFIPSPQSTLPQPPFPTHRSSHPPGSLKLNTDDTNQQSLVDPNLRPSSFYGLQVDPSQERPYDHHSVNRPRSSGTNSPASSLPSDPVDHRHRSLNPHHLVRSTQRRQSSRLSSIPHPQDGLVLDSNNPNILSAAPLLDHSHLKPGHNAKLLNHAKTLELYRANAKKTNDPEVMFEFGCFLMDLVKEMGGEDDDDASFLDSRINALDVQKRKSTYETPKPSNLSEKEKEKVALTQEALFLLQKLANRGHVQSQFLLADCYTKGIGTGPGLSPGGLPPRGSSPGSEPTSPPARKGSKQDYERAFPLFVLAAKHGHVEAMYRAGQCCEYGWGTRKERDKALQFYRKAAIAQHPLAMYRLSLADLNGDLGYPRRPKDGVKWLKRAAELADASHPNSLHELALLHERGLEHVVFVDYDYAVELLARAAELGYAPSAYKLGECYEYGRMGCPQDAALSIHYYNIAAQQNHKEACFALTAWYLVGSPGVLPQSDTEAYLWAKKAAEAGLAKAEYAVGYFTEVGVGTTRDDREALRWFKRAAEHGDKRAKERLRNGIAGVTIDISPDHDVNHKNKNSYKRKTRASFGGVRLNNSSEPNGHPTSANKNPLSASTILPAGSRLSPNGGEESKRGKEECLIV